MELIKLPISLGLNVVSILKQYNIEPRKYEDGPFKGNLSLEFSQEELDLIKELKIENPTNKCLEGIEYLKNLEVLSISTKGSTEYDKSPCTITDKDISKIAKLTNLKSLIINNQSAITWVDLTNLKNLEEIIITKNPNIDTIYGLDKLTKVKDFEEYGNKELYNVDHINKLINNNELDNIDLDVQHYNEILPSSSKIQNMLNCRFVETLSSNQNIGYSYYQMLLFHKKCLSIASEAIKFSPDIKNRIIFIENYLAKNITYDREALNNNDRTHTRDGQKIGRKNGTNSAYNGIMYGSAVCEGYTRSMQYILKLLNIKTKNVYCISGENQIKINESYHNQVILPNDGYHSIIRIDNQDSVYYCDPCWDSCSYHAGIKTLPYCLLTKKEMSKDHTMSFEDDTYDFDIPYPREYILNTIDLIEKQKVR